MSRAAFSFMGNHTGVRTALWILIAIYGASRFLQSFPDQVPMLAIIALHVVPPALFALIHGALLYRLRGILVFIGLCVIVGNIFENLSILTGFPFGHYHFTEVMGPRILQVPVLLGLAYVGMGYLAWTLACLIVGNKDAPPTRLRLVTLPLIASFVMVAWDVSMDPVWSTIVRGWIWHRGGAYFGVPVSNFLGWYLTTYIIYQLFALYLWGRSTTPLPSGYWKLAVVFYAVSAAGNLLVIPRVGPPVVSDPSGAQWKVSDIVGASAVVSIFVMGAFAVLAWVRLAEEGSETGQLDSGLRKRSAGAA